MAKKPIPTTPPSAQSKHIASSPSSKTLLKPVIIKHAPDNSSVLYPIDAIAGTTATLTLNAGSTEVQLYWEIKPHPNFPTPPDRKSVV